MPEAVPSLPILRFGVFELDLRAGELRKQGLKIKLQEKPLQILALLLERPAEVVTREEIRKQLWAGDTFVDFDHGINTAINKLREALGDSAENPRFIETLPRHGYRFIVPLESVAPGYDRRPLESPAAEEPGKGTARGEVGMKTVPDKASVDSSPAAAAQPPTVIQASRERRPWLALVAVAAVAAVVVFGTLYGLNVGGLRGRMLSSSRAGYGVPVPKIESIAVLPLENLSGDPAQEYFADGMTEELITDLGKISALRVISRTSVMQYKETKKPLPEIAKELNVDAIVEGTVRRSGNRVRITANLLYAPTDRHLWAQTYERDLGDVLVLQNEVARAIAIQIRIKLTLQEHALLASSRPVNPQAYRLYLQGRYFFFKRTLPAFNKSIQLFQQALERDPDSALAYAGLSETYAILPFYGGAVPREAFPKARAAALKALELDSTLAEAHAAMGFVLFYYDWDWSAAERELKRAIELKPSYVVAHHWYAEYLSAMGRHEEAFAEIRRAQELDPVSPLMRAIGGEVYYLARRYDAAIEQCRKGIELDSNFGVARKYLAWGYVRKGMYKEAGPEFEKAAASYAGYPVGLAVVCAATGNKGNALKILDQARTQSRHGEILPWELARAYVYLGDRRRALHWLEKGYAERDPYTVFMKVEPAFDPLHSDPRFQALLRRMNFPK